MAHDQGSMLTAARQPVSRRAFVKRAIGLGVGLPVLGGLLAACAQTPPAAPTSAPKPAATTAPAAPTAAPAAAATAAPAQAAATRPLTPTFYQWIVDLHPSLPQVNDDFKKTTPLNFQIAPVQGFGIDRFVAEARDKNSTWDVYVGMTPFVEMSALIQADVIEPWDNYLPQGMLNDLIPSIRTECTVDGKLYSWPFLLDIITMGWNSDLTDKAGITEMPTTWEQYLADGQQVVDRKAAPYGVAFDAHGWRSLAPITHTISTKAYTPDGLFDYTSEPAVEALQLMKQMKDLSAPNILNPGNTDAGVNDTPDENIFAAQQVAYYVKYQNSPLRFAATWPDPKKLRLGPLPKPDGGEGATVFWTTGACLFKYGQNKDKAAEYLNSLTHDERIWKDSIGGSPTSHPGQLPSYQSLYDKWAKDKPTWMEDWVPLVFDQLKVARAIPNTKFGVTQFNLGQPHWEKFLKGEETDPKKAMQAAQDAVMAEVKKG